MSFDLSRVRFDARKDFLGVVMQQGRVQLDADWNEWVAELVRRLQAGSLDTLGGNVVPRITPDGFHIEADSGHLTIGPGRIYVDGLLAENHGGTPEAWDPRLAELAGTTPLDYGAQPYYPDPPDLPAGGPHLVYVDVWLRDVTALQEPDLIEKAVGVDTTGRRQVVWQVKVLPDVGGITCATPDEDVPGWSTITAPSAARLSTDTGTPTTEPDPCRVPPAAGYRGLENQLYRVEVHTGGPLGAATFKWSRDNATVASRVTHINPSRDRVTVESIGRDDVLRFHDGDWVEVTDDWRELKSLPGELRRIRVAGGVDETARTLEFDEPLGAGLFPTDAQQATDPARSTRVRRWDQSGTVRREDGTAAQDLDATGSTGEILIPAAGTRLFLENGILVEFDLDPAGGEFKTGDHWAFAARSVDASIELLDKAPPLGIHHHYARLAVVTFPDSETDCRTLWPPVAEGEGCDCTVCVSAEGHNKGTATLQQAIDSVKETGGTICLGVGTYNLRETLNVGEARSLRIRGQGWATLLVAANPGAALRIESSIGVALENLAVIGSVAGTGDDGVISVGNVLGCELRSVYLVGLSTGGDAVSAGVAYSGYVLGARVSESVLVAELGVTGGAGKERNYLLTGALDLSDNLMWCERRGVSLGRQCLHYGETRVAGNMLLGCDQVGLLAQGGVIPGSALNLTGNVLQVTGAGIVVGTDGARIENNEVRASAPRAASDGITLAPGLDPGGIDHCQIIGNRILGASGNGIAIRTRVNSAMIKQNVIDGTGAGAIVMEDAGSAGQLVIENNQLANIAAGFNQTDQPIAAVRIIATARADVLNNVLTGFARQALQTPALAGVQAAATGELRISGNRLLGLAPAGSFAGHSAAVELLAPFARAALSENTLQRAADASEKTGAARWQGIRVSLGSAEAPTTIGSDLVYAASAETGFLFTASRVRSTGSGRGELAVRGNHLQSSGGTVPLVEVDGVASCIFTENHCVQTTRSATGGAVPLADLRNGAIVASHNRLRGPGELDTMHLWKSAVTVVGNLTSGGILLDGKPLGDPWKPLNVIAS